MSTQVFNPLGRLVGGANGRSLTGAMRAAAVKPPAVFPGGIATDSDLLFAQNRVRTRLVASISATATTITVADPGLIYPNAVVSLGADGEIVQVLGPATGAGNVFPVQRGFDSTTPVAHLAGSEVLGNVVAFHHNGLVSEVEAIEQFLHDTSLATFSNAAHNFCAAPGGNLSVGSNTVRIGPAVKGIAVGNYLYISGGTGIAEAVPITGWNPVNGAVVVVCANAHTGNWNICSATAGIQEALVAAGSPGYVTIATGSWTVHAPIFVPAAANWAGGDTIIGFGKFASSLHIASDFSLSFPALFVLQFNPNITFSYPGPSFRDFGVVYPQNYSLPLTGFTRWPPTILATNVANGMVQNLYISGGWQALVINATGQNSNGQWLIDNCEFGCYGPGVISLDNSGDVHRITNCHFWPFYNANQVANDSGAMFDPAVVGILINTVAGVYLHNCYFLTGTSIRFGPALGSSLITISDCGFDVFGIIDMTRSAGGIQMNLTNCTFFQVQNPGGTGYAPPTASLAFGSAGVTFAMCNCTLYKNNVSQPLVSIVGLFGDNPAFSQISILGNLIYHTVDSAADTGIFRITNTTGAWLRVVIQNNQIAYFYGLNYTHPMLSLTGNGTVLSFQGNSNTGVGSGIWISIQNDDHHFLSGNRFDGPTGAWAVLLPEVKWQGYYQDQWFQYGPPNPVVRLTGPVEVTGYGHMTTYICNAAAGAVQVDLPFVASALGDAHSVKKIDASAHPVVVMPAGGETIDGVAGPRYITTQWGHMSIVCDLYTWSILGSG